MYIEEAAGPAPIRGVEASTGALIGSTPDGPIDTPTLVESAEAFRETFRVPMEEDADAMARAVEGFFANGGRRLYVTRVECGPTAGLEEAIIGTDDDDPTRRTGIHAFRNIDGMLAIAMPGVTEVTTQAALLAMCECEKYKFAILDAAVNASVDDVIAQRATLDSGYGALYYPWLVGGDGVLFPPSGHVMGVYARSDIEHGVHHAAANQVVEGVVGVSREVDEQVREALAPRGINLLRDFTASGAGVRVWGARSLSSSDEWKYVDVRRLLQYMAASIDRGTRWAVFEPNDEPLWERLRMCVSEFLMETWRTGTLAGTRPSDAFFVRCDRTTMTQNDIDNGRLNIEIGIAPTKPAEFVIFRIGQWTSRAT